MSLRCNFLQCKVNGSHWGPHSIAQSHSGMIRHLFEYLVMTLRWARARFFRYFQSTVLWGSHFRVTASVIILPPFLFAWPHQLEWRNTPQNLMYLDTCDLKLHLREGIVSILHFNKNIRCQLPSCVFKSFSKKASSNSKVRSCKKVSAVCNAALLGMIKKKGGTEFLCT